jgi:excisionase family DNA binding protein
MASRKSVNPVPEQTPATTAPSSPQLLLDIRATARALSSSVWAIRALLWNNEIPHIKIGRKFLIDPADLRAFIQRKKEAA